MANRLLNLLLSLAALLASATTCPAEMVRRYQVLVTSGDPAPSIGPGVEFGRISGRPRIGVNGHVVFQSWLVNNGQSDRAIWSGKPGSLRAVAVHGDPAPGRPGETLDLKGSPTAGSPAMCPDGTVAFLAELDPSGDEGVWMGRDGTVDKVLAEGDGLPFGNGVQVEEFRGTPFVANGTGQVVARARLEGIDLTSRNDSAIWTGTAADLALLHWEGQEASPFTGGLELGDVSFSDLTMNAHGEIAFEVLDKALGLGGDENSVLMTGARQGLQVRLREGDPIPGHPGVLWGNFERPQLANDGTVTVFSRPHAPGVGRHGIHHADGSADIPATDGFEAVGAPGLNWEIPLNLSPLDVLRIGGSGTAAFAAEMSSDENSRGDGVWIYRNREVQLVARKGQSVVGDPGESYVDLGGPSIGEGPGVTEDGVVVFWSRTTGGRGFWRWSAGDLQPLILQDDLIEFESGERREVVAVYAKLGGAGQGGGPSGLNDRGQFVFDVFLEGGIFAILLIDDVMDRDGDGVEGLVEEAFGGDPDDPSDGRALLPGVFFENGMVTVSYLQRDDGTFDYKVECSDELQDWLPVNQLPEPADDPADAPIGTTRMQISVPYAAEKKKFFRVRVQRSPNP